MSDQPTMGGGATLPPRDDAMPEELWTAEELAAAWVAAVGSADPEPPAAVPDEAPAGVLANGETVTADELSGMPWYEARVEIYVRNGPPGGYGQGGDKIAHTRAATQAPSFSAAAERLDQELAPRWQRLLDAAPLADQAPSPEVEAQSVAGQAQAEADAVKAHPLYSQVWRMAVAGWILDALLWLAFLVAVWS